jgi:DNA-binding protein H-NS
MKKSELKSMSTEELRALHEVVAEVLTAKITAEQRALEKRLRQIRIRAGDTTAKGRDRLPYREVLPKYRNPLPPHEVWSGRGRKPLWVIEQLKSGKTMEDFRIGGK